jgi:hypothetical protein
MAAKGQTKLKVLSFGPLYFIDPAVLEEFGKSFDVHVG